jgi:SCY1-like protein 2
MEVIRKLGDRVEKEHNQFLRDSQRIGDHSSKDSNGRTGSISISNNMDFESLVGGANGASIKTENKVDNVKSWDDDVWESIFTSNDGVRTDLDLCLDSFIEPFMQAAPIPPPATVVRNQVPSLPPSPKSPRNQFPNLSTTTSRPFASAASFKAGITPSPLQPRSSAPVMQANVPAGLVTTPALQNQPAKPNYNISLTPAISQIASPLGQSSLQPMTPHNLLATSSPAMAAPPQMGSLLAPSKPIQPSWPTGGAPKPGTKNDWGDFDPLA